ncbi:MAG: polysaccharide pyruvyl transferase family protein, partial [Candidatus Limnocylindrales bacterium]
KIGANSGNLIFVEAAHKILATSRTDVTADRFLIEPRAADEISERYDGYVIPLANAFRVSYEANLIRLTQLIERLRIPVVVLGVGVQSNPRFETKHLRRIEPSVRAFVRAVLDHGPSIGVRGAFSASYLAGLGFRDVDVIGCPSMFLNGRSLRVDKRRPSLDRDSRPVINVSPYVQAMGPIVMRHVERYPNLRYIAQDIETLERLLWGEPAGEAAIQDPLPIHGSHPLLRDGKTRLYVDPWPWIEDLAACDFSFGTRIHGNIAAILAGTPAFVFAHDSRTLEMAEYFAIPHRRMRDVPPDVDAADLYEEADFGPLNDGHAERFATFTAYLERHRLEHVFQPGEDPGAFDAHIRAIAFPPAVTARDPAAGSAWRRQVQRIRRAIRRARTAPRVRAWQTNWLRRARRRSGRDGPTARPDR